MHSICVAANKCSPSQIRSFMQMKSGCEIALSEYAADERIKNALFDYIQGYIMLTPCNTTSVNSSESKSDTRDVQQRKYNSGQRLKRSRTYIQSLKSLDL